MNNAQNFLKLINDSSKVTKKIKKLQNEIKDLEIKKSKKEQALDKVLQDFQKQINQQDN